MKTLRFRVLGQKLEAVDIPTDLVKGTSNYLQCAFTFEGADWIGCKVAAEFGDGQAVPIINYSCMVPEDSAARQYFKFRLIGVREDFKIITNEIIIKQKGEING